MAEHTCGLRNPLVDAINRLATVLETYGRPRVVGLVDQPDVSWFTDHEGNVLRREGDAYVGTLTWQERDRVDPARIRRQVRRAFGLEEETS